MKLKTLLMVVAMLCVSLFVVACGGGDDTTATPGTQAPGATTTKAQTTTTKKTTKTTTTQVTTTTVTTTLSPDFFTKIPAKLPNNETYEIGFRMGLESEDDFVSVTGNYDNGKFTTTGAIFGNAWSFECSAAKIAAGSAQRMESYMDLLDPFDVEGVKGVLWYVDFSNVTMNTAGAGNATSTTFNDNKWRSNKEGAIGYYLKDGEWVQTANVTSCRMSIPSGFAGWVYVPITSYTGEGELYDGTTGKGLSNYITRVRLYTDGYVYETGKTIIFDEVLYVK